MEAQSNQSEISTDGGVSLSHQELSRKLWHMSAGLLPFIVPLIPFANPEVKLWSANLMRILIITTTAGLVAISLILSRKFIRPGERQFGITMSCYVLTVIAPLIAFPKHLQFGMTVLAILAIGDGAAGLIGMTVRGPRLPWNSEKTFAGMLGFVLCSTPAAAFAFWISSLHSTCAIAGASALLLGCLASVAGAIAESWTSRVNDNLRVGVVAGLVLMLGHWLLIGAW